ncbi:hypothetical protein DPMN_031616 [Dreissena polymorpha]|uniref:Uncharacterized protein n=1 Tax=Dreissena polymorpha TaxID=45954 RepID=A0A9D4M3G0_DREPO|nr:hypothetical protein DPMN_031616 [Dreissena polymorpha]
MISCMIQEARDYSCECGSSLNACYLKTQSAIDKVWIKGLIEKLYHLGVRGKFLRVIFDSLQICTFRVRSRGLFSEPFPTEQRNRHGSICELFLYIVLINDLYICSPFNLMTWYPRRFSTQLKRIGREMQLMRFTYNAHKCIVPKTDKSRPHPRLYTTQHQYKKRQIQIFRDNPVD